jgi:hypothetical protein
VWAGGWKRNTLVRLQVRAGEGDRHRDGDRYDGPAMSGSSRHHHRCAGHWALSSTVTPSLRSAAVSPSSPSALGAALKRFFGARGDAFRAAVAAGQIVGANRDSFSEPTTI